MVVVVKGGKKKQANLFRDLPNAINKLKEHRRTLIICVIFVTMTVTLHERKKMALKTFPWQ